MPVVKHIGKQGVTKTRGRLRTMFHEWRKVLLESDKACTSQIRTSKKNVCTKYIASIKKKDDKNDTKDDNEHKANFSDIETDDDATPINVWEARGFLVLHTDDGHWNHRDDNNSEMLHKSFSFMKIKAKVMSCTGGPSMDFDILICCLVKEARFVVEIR